MPELNKARRSLIAGHLLLVLCSSLVHSCLHFGFELDLQQVPTAQTGSISLSAAPQRATQPSTLLETCLVCSAQRHNAVLLTAVGVLLDPLRLDHLVVELDQVWLFHYHLDPGLSRAPPLLS